MFTFHSQFILSSHQVLKTTQQGENKSFSIYTNCASLLEVSTYVLLSVLFVFHQRSCKPPGGGAMETERGVFPLACREKCINNSYVGLPRNLPPSLSYCPARKKTAVFKGLDEVCFCISNSNKWEAWELLPGRDEKLS